MKKTIPTLLTDFYKVHHHVQYPEGTEQIYSTWIPRGSRRKGVNKVVAFGFQGFIKEFLIDYFNDNFFNRPLDEVVVEYVRYMKFSLGMENPSSDHIAALHQLGYLPIEIKALPEGTRVPLRVPMLTMVNTVDEFFWVTNYLETLMSTELWMPSTSATIADEYRRILEFWANITTGSTDGVNFQGHDFSMRGHASLSSAMTSGAGHLLSFDGTDTIPAIMYLEQYYNANIEKELVGTSIPATEHSVMCTYGQGGEFDTYKRLITEVYPKGFISIVSDTWDLWKVLREIIAPLKEDILARDGKVVIRPDSGDPVKIICGDPSAENELVHKGVIEILWDIFGGEVNNQGYKVLNSKIGAIYGDAITIERAEEICERLATKGFASTNIVFGIGSFTYQCNTRDTFGFALKSTFAVVNGEDRLIFKDPITDDGTKKSLRGLVGVRHDFEGELVAYDGMNRLQYSNRRCDYLETIFKDGKLVKEVTLAEIRARVRG